MLMMYSAVPENWATFAQGEDGMGRFSLSGVGRDGLDYVVVLDGVEIARGRVVWARLRTVFSNQTSIRVTIHGHRVPSS